ncbi:hypothetical protein AB4254_10850 [Vibrio breoganii]
MSQRNTSIAFSVRLPDSSGRSTKISLPSYLVELLAVEHSIDELSEYIIEVTRYCYQCNYKTLSQLVTDQIIYELFDQHILTQVYLSTDNTEKVFIRKYERKNRTPIELPKALVTAYLVKHKILGSAPLYKDVQKYADLTLERFGEKNLSHNIRKLMLDDLYRTRTDNAA